MLRQCKSSTFGHTVLNNEVFIPMLSFGVAMDLTKVLAELHQEREHIDEAIQAFSLLAANSKRRGRPPAWLAAVKPKHRGRPFKSAAAPQTPSLKGRQRKGMSAAARKSERMKAYWAARRKKQGKRAA